jgi:hypothetical protein
MSGSNSVSQRSTHFLLFVLLLVLSSSKAFAQDVEIEGLNYALDSPADGEASITGYIVPPVISLTIPSTVTHEGKTYSVTQIGGNSFFSANLTSISIPDSVTSIGDDAFSDNRLTALTIPNSVTSIGSNAFAWNDLSSLIIPDSVTSLGDSAFTGVFSEVLINPPSLTIGNGIASWGQEVFTNNNLTSVTLREGLTTIGNQAFAVNKLTSVTLPDSITSLGFGAFQGNLLTSVTWGKNITSIGESTFENNFLISITIPDTVTSIGQGAFFNNKIIELTIGNAVTSIGAIAFGENNNLIAVTFLGDYSTDFSREMFNFNDQIGLIEFDETRSGWNDISFINGESVISATPGDFSVADVVIPDVPQESLSGIITSNGTASGAGISVGASSDGGASSAVSFSADDDITLTAKVYPDSNDLGKEGEIYVVLRTIVDGKKTFFALNEDGQWEAWNTSLKSLPTALYADSLEEAEEVLIYSGQMIVGERLMYVGYSLFTDGGKPLIHTNGKPFKFDVAE